MKKIKVVLYHNETYFSHRNVSQQIGFTGCFSVLREENESKTSIREFYFNGCWMTPGEYKWGWWFGRAREQMYGTS